MRDPAHPTMKALRVHGYGPDDRVVLDDIEVPLPAPGQVRVRVQASGISFVDLLVARGGYQVRLPTPFVPGSEFAGTVDALGDGVRDLAVGDLVCGTRQGAWAQWLCADARAVFQLQADASVTEAAVLLAPNATALYALRERAGLRAGETLLVLGATGGVGHAAVQVGKAMGARVIAVATGEAKRRAAQEAGADEAVDGGTDWKDEIKQWTGRAGVAVVFDPVGGPATEAAFRTLGWNGRHLMVGFAAGDIASLKTNLAIVKGASLVGVDLRQLSEREPAAMARICRDVLAYHAQGVLRPRIHGVWPMDRFDEASAQAQARETIGRVVLEL